MKSLLNRSIFRASLFACAALFTFALSAGRAHAQATSTTESLTATLTSLSQVPAVLATGSGTFQAQVTMDGNLQFTLSYSNMSSSVVQAHIHFGASKTNGGVMVFLCGGPKAACPASGTITGSLTAADVSVLPATNGDSVIPQGIQPGDLGALLTAIRSGNAYVNVHTANFPNGEIRGQVHLR